MCTACLGVVPAWGAPGKALLVRSQWQDGLFALGYCKDWTHGCILVSFLSLHFCVLVGVISTPAKAANHPFSCRLNSAYFRSQKNNFSCCS